MEARILASMVATIERSRELLTSREAVVHALVLPLLRALGYAVSNPVEVRCGQAITLGSGEAMTADVAIYEDDGVRPRMVLEVRPLGCELLGPSPLLRALGPETGLRLLVVTDGARYHFYSGEAIQGAPGGAGAGAPTPLLALSLVGEGTDLTAVARELERFARAGFDADAWVRDAEDDALQAALSDRLAGALRAPASDPSLLRWLSDGLYDGKRTRPVLERLGHLAEEAVMPAILTVLSDRFIEHLREHLRATAAAAAWRAAIHPHASGSPENIASEPAAVATIRAIAGRAGIGPEEVVHRETTNYIGFGLGNQARWFARWFDGSRRRALTTLVPLEEAQSLVRGFPVEAAPQSFGVSRVSIEEPAQLWALEALIGRSLELCRRGEQLAITGADG